MKSKEELAELVLTDVDAFNEAMNGDAADLTETDFSNSSIEGAVFNNADLTSTSFADSQLTDVKFINCDLTSVDFTRSTVVECSFNDSVLNGTDFSYAKLDYCKFNESDLAGAILREADFSNSDLSSAENLNACRFDDTTVWPDSDNLPEDFDSTYSDDLSSLKDDDDYESTDY